MNVLDEADWIDRRVSWCELANELEKARHADDSERFRVLRRLGAERDWLRRERADLIQRVHLMIMACPTCHGRGTVSSRTAATTRPNSGPTGCPACSEARAFIERFPLRGGT